MWMGRKSTFNSKERDVADLSGEYGKKNGAGKINEVKEKTEWRRQVADTSISQWHIYYEDFLLSSEACGIWY